jgi:hypothetical protein
MPSFEMEKAQVVRLMQRLGLSVAEYRNPNEGGYPRDETGADVIALVNGRRVGIQVTDIDTGDVPGGARSAEAKLPGDAKTRDTTYSAWGQNQPEKMTAGIARSISRKSRMSFSGFDDFWLLICCGVPQFGAIASTFVMTPWIDVETLDAATLQSLSDSKYTKAFIYAVLGVEEQALYQWQRGGSWVKSIVSVPPEHQGPSFWEYRNDPDLHKDPDAWRDREIERFFAEQRKTKGGS